MTEAEWLACSNPDAMVRFLQGKASDRKLRLLACEACRSLAGFITQFFPNQEGSLPEREEFWNALRTAERFVEGAATSRELTRAHKAWQDKCDWSEYAFLSTANPSAWNAADQTIMAVGDWIAELPLPDTSPDPVLAAQIDDPTYEAGLVRCSFGSLPFRSVPFAQPWLTTPVLSLAQAIYDNRAFDRLPILADALEEAGCTDAAILEHCRGPGPHVRGCWVVDLLLGKN